MADEQLFQARGASASQERLSATDLKNLYGRIMADLPGRHVSFKRAHPDFAQEAIETALRQAEALPVFQGAVVQDAEGTPAIILRARSKHAFKQFRERGGFLFGDTYMNEFGNVVTFVIRTHTNEREYLFVAEDAALLVALRKHQRLLVALTHNGQLSPWYVADFKPLPSAREWLAITDRGPLAETFMVAEPMTALWRLAAKQDAGWADSLSVSEKMRTMWATVLTIRMKTFREYRDLALAENLSAPFVDAAQHAWTQEHAPWVWGYFSLLLDPSVSLAQLIEYGADLRDPVVLQELLTFCNTTPLEQYASPHISATIWNFIEIILRAPGVTRYGLMRPWLEPLPDGVGIQAFLLEPEVMGGDAALYWHSVNLRGAYHQGHFLRGTDVPVPWAELAFGMQPVKLGVELEDASQTITELLQEAFANRQWTVPWGARLQIDLGIFRWVDVHECEGSFYFALRDAQERFCVVSASLRDGSYFFAPCPVVVEGVPRDDDDNLEAMLAVMLTCAAALRDFLVVEERQRVFGTRATRLPRHRNVMNPTLSVVYLPRVRYVNPDLQQYHHEERATAGRGPHPVAGHLRKSTHATATQQMLAMHYGIAIPQGYTFVRPHQRGLQEQVERQKIYRSRSVTHLLYHTVVAVPGGVPDWFKFEQDVAELMRCRGLEVIHLSANRNGDGGIDIFATDLDQRAWAIQCKCWALHRPVGPAVVRELLGSMHRYPAGTRGLIVTTSRFTEMAQREAAQAAIELMDGEAFAQALIEEEQAALP